MVSLPVRYASAAQLLRGDEGAALVLGGITKLRYPEYCFSELAAELRLPLLLLLAFSLSPAGWALAAIGDRTGMEGAMPRPKGGSTGTGVRDGQLLLLLPVPARGVRAARGGEGGSLVWGRASKRAKPATNNAYLLGNRTKPAKPAKPACSCIDKLDHRRNAQRMVLRKVAPADRWLIGGLERSLRSTKMEPVELGTRPSATALARGSAEVREGATRRCDARLGLQGGADVGAVRAHSRLGHAQEQRGARRDGGRRRVPEGCVGGRWHVLHPGRGKCRAHPFGAGDH